MGYVRNVNFYMACHMANVKVHTIYPVLRIENITGMHMRDEAEDSQKCL